MSDYVKSAAAVCRVWKEDWAGAVMVSLEYTPGTEMAPDAYRISVSEKRLIKISAENETGDRLVMTMMRPRIKDTETQKETPQKTAGLLPWKCFSAEEIAAAADRIGDHNPIHHGARPVAGGFLLLSEIIARYPGGTRYTLRFCGKVFAGEDIFLRETEEGTEAYTAAGLAFRVEISNE